MPNFVALIGRELYLIARIAVLGSFFLSCLAEIDQSYLVIDLISHFRLQYFGVGVAGLVFFSYIKSKYFVTASLCSIILNITHVLPYIKLPGNIEVPPPAPNHLALMLTNIRTENTKYENFLSLIYKKSPDIAVVLELNQEWINQIESLLATYPYFKFYPRQDNFGIGILSRYEFTINRDSLKTEFGVPYLDVDLNIDSKAHVRLIGLHTLPPSSRWQHQARNSQLNETAKFVTDSSLPTIVAGDFNTTPWTKIYRDFLVKTKLVDPRIRFGLMPTWPATFSTPLIPIDHILFSKHFTQGNFERVDISGSDHSGLLINLTF